MSINPHNPIYDAGSSICEEEGGLVGGTGSTERMVFSFFDSSNLRTTDLGSEEHPTITRIPAVFNFGSAFWTKVKASGPPKVSVPSNIQATKTALRGLKGLSVRILSKVPHSGGGVFSDPRDDGSRCTSIQSSSILEVAVLNKFSMRPRCLTSISSKISVRIDVLYSRLTAPARFISYLLRMLSCIAWTIYHIATNLWTI